MKSCKNNKLIEKIKQDNFDKTITSYMYFTSKKSGNPKGGNYVLTARPQKQEN